MRRIKTLLLLFAVQTLLALGSGASPNPAQQPLPPSDDIRLVLIVAIDQGRAEYLERFAPSFKGGLAHLRSHGVIFEDAHQDHAVTATGPGHSTIGTGAYPATSGIVGNQWYENEGRERVYCVVDDATSLISSSGEESGEGRSPKNLKVGGFSHWLKSANAQSKVFTASRKDRAAILMGGTDADAAFWYDSSTGEFISSDYYFEEMPQWVNDFHARKIPETYFGKFWEPLETQVDQERFSLRPADYGWFERAFPYAIGSATPVPSSSFYSDFGSTPLMDEYLVEFARALVEGEKLGKDQHVDYLGISLSALDSVGHAFGPNSLEIFDEFLRMDRSLGRFFDFLDAEIGLDHVAIAFTADHGVMPIPEYLQAEGLTGHRMDSDDIACIQNRGKDFLTRYGAEEDWFLSGFYLNYGAVGRHNLLRQDVERDAAELLEQCDFIRKVWTGTELDQPGTGDPFHRLFKNNFFRGRSPDLYVQMEEYFLTSQGTGTSHGSPYSYDTHVPLIVVVPGLEPGKVEERVATVDIAPTFASLLGIRVKDPVDGRDLSDLLRRAPSRITRR